MTIRKLKPLDIVKSPMNRIGIVTEVSESQPNFVQYSVRFFKGQKEHIIEKTAWWNINELEYLDNIAGILSDSLAHPFGNNKEQGNIYR